MRNGWALASQFYQPLASPVGGVVIAFMFGCVVVFVFFSIAGKILRRSPILRFLVSICLLTIVGIIGYALIDIKWIHPEQYNKPAVDRATITANYVAQPAPAPRHKKPVVQYHPDTRTMADMAPEYQQCAAKTEASIPWVPNRDHTIMIAPGKTDIIEAVHSACDKFDHHSPSMPHYQPSPATAPQMMADDAWNRCLAARRNIPHVEGEKAFCYPMEVDGVVQQGCGFDADWNRYSAALHDACAADQ